MKRIDKTIVSPQDIKLLWDMTKQKNIGGERLQKYLVNILKAEGNIHKYAFEGISNFSPIVFLIDKSGHSLNIKDFCGRNLLFLFFKNYFVKENEQFHDDIDFFKFVNVLSKHNSWYEETPAEEENNAITYFCQHLLDFDSKLVFKYIKICEENGINWSETLNSDKDTIFHVLLESQKRTFGDLSLYEKEKRYVNFFALLSFLSKKCNVLQKNQKNMDPLKYIIKILDKMYDEKVLEIDNLKWFSEVVLKLVPKEKINYYYSFFFQKEINNVLDKEKLIFDMLDNGWNVNSHLSNGQTILGLVIYNCLNETKPSWDKYESLVKKLIKSGANINQKNIFSLTIFDLADTSTKYEKELIKVLRDWGLVEKEKEQLLKSTKNHKNFIKKNL